MTAALVFDVGLSLLLIGVACCALAGRDLFASIAFFVIYGILVSLVWLRVGAVDVALAEIAIGAGLSGVLLIGAWAALRRIVGSTQAEADASKRAKVIAATVSIAVTVMLAVAVLKWPDEAAGQLPLVKQHLAGAGVENPVTAVLLNFRGYDTLLESMVLLLALIAVWTLTPNSQWGRRLGLPQHVRRDGVLASFGRLLPPLGFMVGVYLVWMGSSQPGGAFQAGTILAAVWLLAIMAGIARAPRQSDTDVRVALVVGPTVFVGVGIVGALSGTFLGYPVNMAKTVILLIEFVLTISIAAALTLLVLGVPQETT